MSRSHRRLWRALAVFSLLLLSTTSLSFAAEARAPQAWPSQGGNVESSRPQRSARATRTRPPRATRTPASTRTPTRTPTQRPTQRPTQTATSTRAPSSTPSNTPSNGSFQSSLESEFLTLINNYRAQNGLGALTRNGALNAAARNHSQDMAVNRYFSHYSPDGKSPFTRMSEAGYQCSGSKGENIAAGYSSAQAAFDAWKNSSGHDANMRNGSYRAIGIGVYYDASSPYRYYWTTTFGSCQ